MQKICESCCTLQGDAELILQAKSVFQRIDKEIEEWFSCDCFGDVKEKAPSLINIDNNRYSDKLESANSALNAAKENTAEGKAKLDPIISQRDGVTTGGAIMQPAFDYYDKLFKDDKGDCADMMEMAEAVEMFNPIMLSMLFSVWLLMELLPLQRQKQLLFIW